MGFFELIGREMSGWDCFLFWSGNGCALIFGAALPSFSLFFGEMIDDLGSQMSDDNAFESLKFNAIVMSVIGVIGGVLSSFQIINLSLFSESISFKTKITYFKRCLE